MRAIVLHETGGPEVLRLEDVPEPEPAEGEVLIRVEAAGVNHYDLNQRAGGATRLPRILGSDAGGTTEDGTRVLVTGARGAYAELTVAAAETSSRSPTRSRPQPRPRIGVPYRTAWWALVDVARLAEGDTLLVQAGSSATGSGVRGHRPRARRNGLRDREHAASSTGWPSSAPTARLRRPADRRAGGGRRLRPGRRARRSSGASRPRPRRPHRHARSGRRPARLASTSGR